MRFLSRSPTGLALLLLVIGIGVIVFVFSGRITRAFRGAESSPTPTLAVSRQAVGYDVSWPNCRAQPPKGASWGIVGVNGGRVFQPNPCLKQQIAWFAQPSLYVNTAYPGIAYARKYADSPRRCGQQAQACLAYNYGYQAGRYAVTYASRQDVHAAWWWLDVETVNSWTADTGLNRQSLQGMIDSIRQQVTFARFGFYSIDRQWDIITGGWRNELPVWTATGAPVQAPARRACSQPSFTGGENLMGQYTVGLDRNLFCGAAGAYH